MKKELYQDYFKNKKGTVMGLGLLGRGIGDTAFLAACGAELIVTDKKSEVELTKSLETLREYSSITYHLGEHSLADFENRDFVMKAAGVPLDSEYVAHARQQEIPVYMSAALIVKIIREQLKNVTVIGVTGTRGKSTTTYLIAHLLETAGKRVHLGGNVRGVANLPLLESIEEGDYLVLELDSWQLQGFKDLGISPNIAVFTSFLDDHLNYYHNDREAYFNDKAGIFINQKDGDVLIVSPQAHGELLKRGMGDDAIVPEVLARESQLIGEHNEVLISLAYEVGQRCGVDSQILHEGIKTFKPAPGRLECIGIYRGVTVYNDNNATTPDAVIMALRAIVKTHAIKSILICGGADKTLELSALKEEIRNNTKHYVLLAGTGTDKLSLNKDMICETLGECVAQAFSLAAKGDVIIFSPGFASFSTYFKNEYERNDAFVSAIQKYI